MAEKTGGNPIVIRITRNMTGPPRRANGQVLRMTRAQIKQQGLVKDRDYELETKRKVKKSTKKTSTKTKPRVKKSGKKKAVKKN